MNSIEGLVDSAIQDGGLAQLYSYQASRYIAEGALQIVLDHYEIDSVPVNLICPQGRFVPQKVRVFIDFALPRFRDCLADIQMQCRVS